MTDDWLELDSSHVKAISRVDDDLLVRFADRSVYKHYGAAKDHYDALAAHDSPGGYFVKNVKGKYPHSKVE